MQSWKQKKGLRDKLFRGDFVAMKNWPPWTEIHSPGSKTWPKEQAAPREADPFFENNRGTLWQGLRVSKPFGTVSAIFPQAQVVWCFLCLLKCLPIKKITDLGFVPMTCPAVRKIFLASKSFARKKGDKNQVPFCQSKPCHLITGQSSKWPVSSMQKSTRATNTQVRKKTCVYFWNLLSFTRLLTKRLLVFFREFMIPRRFLEQAIYINFRRFAHSLQSMRGRVAKSFNTASMLGSFPSYSSNWLMELWNFSHGWKNRLKMKRKSPIKLHTISKASAWLWYKTLFLKWLEFLSPTPWWVVCLVLFS